MKEVWSVICVDCDRIFKFKNEKNEEIEKPIEEPTNETSGICPLCLDVTLRPLIGLA